MQAVISTSCAIILLTTALAETARAGDDPREVARAHYAQGIELANQGLYQAALEQFNAAYDTSPHFAVLYNVGQAQMALGRPIEAVEALSRYLREGADQVPLSRRQQVQAQIGLLESRLAELSVTTDRPGASIRVDGRDVGSTPLFQSIRLAAGTHTVTASFPDGPPVTRSLTLTDAERRTLELALVATTPQNEPPVPATPDPAPRVAMPPAPALQQRERAAAGAGPDLQRGSSIRWAAYGIGGAGVLLAGATLGVYLWRRGRYDDWLSADAALRKDASGSTTYRTQAISNNALAASLTGTNRAIKTMSVVSGALVATGAVLLVADRAHDRHAGEIAFWSDGGSSAHVAWSCVW